MTTYTPGALRAAQAIVKKSSGDYTSDERECMAIWRADIISRETGDAGLLEALKEALIPLTKWAAYLSEMGPQHFGQHNIDEAVAARKRAEKAIAQAQEGKPNEI